MGIRGEGEPKHFYLLHPETHGNSLKFDSDQLTVLITEPILVNTEVKGRDILKRSLSFTPYFEIYIDMQKEEVKNIKQRFDRGK